MAVILRIRIGTETKDYAGKSVTNIIHRVFGRSKNTRLLPNYDCNAPEYFTIGKWEPKCNAYTILGVIYSVGANGRSLSKEEAREFVNAECRECECHD